MNSRDLRFYSELRQLNEDFFKLIEATQKTSPYFDFTPTLQDYIKQFNDLDVQYPERKSPTKTDDSIGGSITKSGGSLANAAPGSGGLNFGSLGANRGALFGSNSTGSATPFSTGTTTSAPTFGITTTTGTNVFGSSTTTTTNSGSTNFGGNATGGMSFGTPATTGINNFGSNTTSNAIPFGSIATTGTSSFGTAATTSGTTSFGTIVTTTAGFGSSANAGTTSFGINTTSGPTGFGTLTGGSNVTFGTNSTASIFGSNKNTSILPGPGFGSAVAASTTEEAADDDAPPPEPNVDKYEEPDAKFQVRCKLYERGNMTGGTSSASLLGYGVLFVKELDQPSKLQVIVRQDPDLRRVMLNQVITQHIPLKLISKAVQLLVPGPSGETKFYIAKVKEEKDANQLFELLNSTKNA